jgi:hypothetical protein
MTDRTKNYNLNLSNCVMVKVHDGWVIIHGIRVMVAVLARLRTGTGGGSSGESWVDI